MNDVKQNLNEVNRGWIIHIYDGDRRLLFTLDPSHAWVFIFGIALGILLMLGWSGSIRRQPNPVNTNAPLTAPLSVD